MSFFTSLFSCCLGKRAEDEKSAAAEARHARIMNMYADDSNSPQPIVAAPPPCYADIAHDRPFVPADEKAPLATEDQQLQFPPQARRSSVSGSSVISVPSTRLSDLTSAYTGTIRHGNAGDDDAMSARTAAWSDRTFRESDDSAPPSYYAGSERSITPVPVPTLSPPPPAFHRRQHPVMEEGWIEQVLEDWRRDTLRQAWPDRERRHRRRERWQNQMHARNQQSRNESDG